MSETINILAFAPHPDDAELSCGGLLVKSALRGHKTAIVDLTKGELSSRGDLESRAAETKRASEILGLSLRENVGLADGAITDNDESRKKIVQVLRRLRPELVLIPYWHERHPDHEATSVLVTHAVFLAGVRKFHLGDLQPFTPKQVLYYPLRFEFRPSFIVDVTEAHPRKMDGIRAFTSQLHSAKGGAKTLLSSPLQLEAVAARDRHHGAMIGVEFGEPYLARNVVPIADPVEHFRNQEPPLYGPDFS